MIRITSSLTEDEIKPDLTPLLDIIFIVMVFLLLTASIKLQSLEVQLPTSDVQADTALSDNSVSINILSQQPYWAVQGKSFADWPDFTSALLKAVKDKKQPDIVIASDKTAHIQHMVKLFAFLQENNIQATQILIEEENR
ncbi:ExbD/TolR family protein [Psychromonas aquimarina]|uniref:ExbD/TolR family protein n=1 Tax=Psychromonas aquimarina TaxID=444919 RepID=UPI0004160BE4|nr:biopolymer transporter ExbD [Psychromonas aquimarina]